MCGRYHPWCRQWDSSGIYFSFAVRRGTEASTIEAVITTDEEVGMNGAKALDLSGLKSEYMINLIRRKKGICLQAVLGIN